MLRTSHSRTLVLFIGFMLRTLFLTRESLWRDEVDAVRFAFEPLGSLSGFLARAGFNGPLYHLALRGWLSATGVNDFGLRYLSVVFGMLLLALTYVIARHLFGARAALIAALLATLSPVLVWYAGEGKMYAMQPALLALALYALLQATRPANHNARWWALYIAATSLGFYVHVLSPLSVAVAGVVLLARWPESRRHLGGAAVALALFVLPYAPLVWWQFDALRSGNSIGHEAYTLGTMAQTLLFNWTIGLDGAAPLFAQGMPQVLVNMARWLSAIALWGVALWGAVRAGRSRWILLAWLVLPTLLIYLVSLRIPIFQPRYVLWCAPALYILAGHGLAKLDGLERRGLLALVSVVSLLGIAAQLLHTVRYDMRSAVAALRSAVKPGDAIVLQIPYARYTVQYYAPDLPDVALVDGPYTNNGATEEDVAGQLAPALAGHSRVWLIETELPLWDEAALTHSWLSTHAGSERYSERWQGVSLTLFEQGLGRLVWRGPLHHHPAGF